MEDLANMTVQGTPVSVNPATPSDHPENEPAQQNVTVQITLDNDGQGDNEQGGTAATDLKLLTLPWVNPCRSHPSRNSVERLCRG